MGFLSFTQRLSCIVYFHFQGGYSPNGGVSEMYGSIGGHYSSHFGNMVEYYFEK